MAEMPKSPREYINLYDLIDFDGFDWGNWREAEKTVLQPRLEALGYTNVEWFVGESDDFGPLTRVARGEKDGETVWFIYG